MPDDGNNLQKATAGGTRPCALRQRRVRYFREVAVQYDGGKPDEFVPQHAFGQGVQKENFLSQAERVVYFQESCAADVAFRAVLLVVDDEHGVRFPDHRFAAAWKAKKKPV